MWPHGVSLFKGDPHISFVVFQMVIIFSQLNVGRNSRLLFVLAWYVLNQAVQHHHLFDMFKRDAQDADVTSHWARRNRWPFSHLHSTEFRYCSWTWNPAVLNARPSSVYHIAVFDQSWSVAGGRQERTLLTLILLMWRIGWAHNNARK